MNFSVYNTFPIGQLYGATSPKAHSFTSVPKYADNLSVNKELDKYLDKRVIAGMIEDNPVIYTILKSQNLKPVINVENFKNTTYKHSIDTKNKAIGIYNYLPADLKAEANLNYIQKGALLHDIGKVLIPEKILNKQGKLTPEEAEIMHLHSKLSNALLATQNLEPEVLNIVKYHHQNKKGTGYPEIKNTLNGFDINTEIVALADKYSALTEKRAYKAPLSPDEALNIIKKDVEVIKNGEVEGSINPRIYNALVGYVNSLNKQTQTKVIAA